MTKSRKILITVLAFMVGWVLYDITMGLVMPVPVPASVSPVEIEAVEGKTPEERHQRRLDKIEEERQRRLLDKELPKPPGPLQQLFMGGIIGNGVKSVVGIMTLLGMAPQIAMLLLWLVLIGCAVWVLKQVLGVFRGGK